MAAPSVTKAAVFGRISKPAIQVPAKCDSPPVCRKSYAWIGTKRKRDDSEVKEETAALTAVPLPCKKVEGNNLMNRDVREADPL